MSDKPEQDWLKQLGKWDPEIIPPLEPDKKYHVFIAYADNDKDIGFATKLYYTLQHVKFKVFFGHADIIHGKEKVTAESDALDASRRVIAIQSPSAIGKGGDTGGVEVEFKFNLAAACCRMITEGQVLTIPVLKNTSERDIPLTAKHGNHVDCTRHPQTWFKELYDLLTAEGAFLGDICPITNIGEGAAWSYVNGYLKVISPYVEDNMQAWCHKTSMERPHQIPVNKVSFKLHVVIPESGHIVTKFCEADENINDIEGLTIAKRDHAGDVGRPYSTTVHEVKDRDGTPYYFVGEFASIVKSMYETMQSSLTTLNTSNFRQQVIKFSNTLELLSNYRQTKPIADKLEITRYIDQGDNVECLSHLLVDKIKKEIRARPGEERMEH